MATPSRPSTASARLRNKTSELSDLFRSRQHSFLPSSSTDPAPKAKRKIPLFSLRKKSPAAPDTQLPPTPPVPTPSSSMNPTSQVASTYRQAQSPQLTIPRSSFSPLPAFDNASSSKRSSTSPTNSRPTRSPTCIPSSNSPSTFSKSRTPTPTSAVTLGGGSFSDSEPPRSNARMPMAVLRSYASDDEERRYLSACSIPLGKPVPTKSLPPPPENTSFSTAYPTPITPTSPSISFRSPANSYTPLPPDAKLPQTSVRKFAVSTSTARSTSFRLTGSKATSPPSPKSRYPPVSLSRASPPTSRTSLERIGSSRHIQVIQPSQFTTSKSPSEMLMRGQTGPAIAPSNTKHASWLVIPKPAQPSANSSGPPGEHESKITALSELRARAASDSRTFTAADSISPAGSSSQASTTSGASAQSITATQALTATSPLNHLKSPSTVAPTSSQPNRVESRTNSSLPTEPLLNPPRPNLSRISSDTSRQAGAAPFSGSPSSSESSTRTITIPAIPSSTPHTVSASGTDFSNTLSSTASTVKSLPSLPSASGNTRRPKDERVTGKDKSKDSTWPARSASKQSSPPGSSLPVQPRDSSESPPYASPSSFSASTTALPTPSISTPQSLQAPPSRVIVPIPPTPANLFALQTENADFRLEIASLREQLENADRLARRREQEIRGLRWLVINWGGDKKDTIGFTSTTERRRSGDNAGSQEEVQAAVAYLHAESESGYGSGSASATYSRTSHLSTYSSVNLAESVSDAQRFGPGPSVRAVVSQGMLTNNLAHEVDSALRERIGLKGMDKVLDKLQAAAGGVGTRERQLGDAHDECAEVLRTNDR